MLKMCVVGNPFELYRFINDLKSQPQYEVKIDSKGYISPVFKEKENVVKMNFVPEVCKPLTVNLETEKEEEVKIHFWDSIMVEMQPGVTWISGKVFEIKKRATKERLPKKELIRSYYNTRKSGREN
ncbi:hypothetical protein [Lihuaxuella thermophila]|uniref:Uncharacterized protein n=1 Tax=Lihuaxuella thermophila TaxID=1173111 RepID=A0A1H8FRP2_9BACL|nr:hypothetical protein [Lihuaxuella thermophila]SEN33768.1 hypothetical protein SAMN05444955_1096 [Lihuaxuella thermophila]